MFAALRGELSAGRVRLAYATPSTPDRMARQHVGQTGHPRRIPLRRLVDVSVDGGRWFFGDKDTLPLKKMTTGMGVRVVPGGSSIRDGASLAKGVICVPPMYINVGAYVDEVESRGFARARRLVRPGRQARAHLRGRADRRCDRAHRRDAVSSKTTCSSAATPASTKARSSSGARSLAQGRSYRLDTDLRFAARTIIKPEGDAPLEVPEGAVVVPGSRAVTQGMGPQWGLSLSTPVIVKYRDEKTDARTNLEQWVR